MQSATYLSEKSRINFHKELFLKFLKLFSSLHTVYTIYLYLSIAQKTLIFKGDFGYEI